MAKDLAQQVTDQIIARIEQGGLLPWQLPWELTGSGAWPLNWASKTQYSGINILLLWLAMERYGYSCNAWMTYKQAKQMGGTVRKGEKGHTVVFYKSLPVGDADADDDDRSSRSVWLKRAFTVFNLDQIDGVERPQVPVRTWESGEASARWEALFASYLANTGVRLERGGDRAFYVPATDVIVLPTTFKSEAGYVSTATHEAAHSTGHPSRLNRFRKQEYDGRVLDAREAYAQEELVAELASCFFSAELGIPQELEQHASYIDRWLSALRGDKNFIFRAAAQASKAYQFILDGGVSLPVSDAA